MRSGTQPGVRRPPTRAPKAAKPAKRKRKYGWFWRYRRVWFLFGLLAFTALAGAVWVITQIPLPSEAPLAQTTLIYDTAGEQIAELHGVENRYPVKIDQVPAITQAAVMAAEDRHFLEHRGVDPFGIARATWADIRNEGEVQGGSTITQQYVKNQIVGSDRTLVRKLKEAVVAIKLERKYSKPEILEKYLNTVYFGRGAYGIQAAAKTYFQKDVSELDLKESAYLAGVIRTPSNADVFEDAESAYFLRTSVLNNLVRDAVISRQDADQVEAIKLESYVFRPERADTTFTNAAKGSEYFIDYVRQKLVNDYGEDRVLRGGLRVYTTLDSKIQTMAYDAIYDTLPLERDPIGSLVSLDAEGRVVAMVGNKDWSQSQVNVAVGAEGGGGGRQGGSAFKPFVLTEALKQGIPLEGRYFPAPAEIGPLPGWEDVVRNYNNAGFGAVNLVEATAYSVNTVYAQLVNLVGAQNVANTARDLGISSPLDPVPSIALGSQNVSVLEMATAYLTFYKDGIHVDPRVITRITDGGSVLVDDRPTGRRRAISADIAQRVKTALGAVVDHGSGTAAAVPNSTVWGKTGTTEEYGDAWFVGANEKLVTAVWMGHPEGQSRPLLNVEGIAKVSGGTWPAIIFRRFMHEAAPGEGKPAPLPSIDVRSLNAGSSGTGTTVPAYSGGGFTTEPDEELVTPTTLPAATSQSPGTTVADSPPVTAASTPPATNQQSPVLTAPSRTVPVPTTSPTRPMPTFPPSFSP